MVLKRKDGSEYRLSRPNKLLVTQNFWNDEPVKVYNFDQLAKVIIGLEDSEKEIEQPPQLKQQKIIIDKTPPKRKVEEEPKNRVIDSVDEISKVILNEPLEEKSKKQDVEPETKEPETKEPVVPSRFRNLERCILFCLPAKVSKHKDGLYGEEVVRLEYESPFRFQGTIASSDDFNMVYWTTVDRVTERSIIFHSSRYRWWQVNEILEDSTGDGLILKCTPSELKPDFS